jgi:hypothetical protein
MQERVIVVVMMKALTIGVIREMAPVSREAGILTTVLTRYRTATRPLLMRAKAVTNATLRQESIV